MSLEELRSVFKGLGKSPFWITFSGGEPFLRKDLAEICATASEMCSPRIMNIPSNGLLPKKIVDAVKRIMGEVEGKTEVIINFSLDALEERQDDIRGIKGCFDRVMESFHLTAPLRGDFPNLRIGIHTVFSAFNADQVDEVFHFVEGLDVDAHIVEIAEKRSELFTKESPIQPDLDIFRNTMQRVSGEARRRYLHDRFAVLLQSFRSVYYDFVYEAMTNKRQPYPCLAGFVSCQINAWGDVWPCCILGYEKPLGNLRDFHFDFGALWRSRNADLVREEIKSGMCHCPLANASYTNFLYEPRAIARVLLKFMESVRDGDESE